jgi:hypothetical protein
MNPPASRHAIAQEKDRAALAARQQFLADLHATFDTPPGQATLRRLRAAAGLPVPAGPWGAAVPARRCFLPSPSGGGACPYLAAAAEGRRSLVEDLENWLAEPREGIAPPAVTGGPSKPRPARKRRDPAP